MFGGQLMLNLIKYAMKNFVKRLVTEVIETVLAQLLIRYKGKIVSYVKEKQPELADEVDELLIAVINELQD